jgi:hypothetical protein
MQDSLHSDHLALDSSEPYYMLFQQLADGFHLGTWFKSFLSEHIIQTQQFLLEV